MKNMRIRLVTYLLLLITLISCGGGREVSFSWSPTTPSTGKAVKFTNGSKSGEDWAWDFGDRYTSTSKNPTHTFKKAGQYTVRLVVDGKSSDSYTATITVVDSIPSIIMTTDSVNTEKKIAIFHDATFRPGIYNPYGHTLSYDWTIYDPDQSVCDTSTQNYIKTRFNTPGEREVRLTIHDQKDHADYELSTKYEIVDFAGAAVLYSDGTQNYFQRYFGPNKEDYEPTRTSSAKHVTDALSSAQDETCTYNNKTYTLTDISSITGESVLGFTIYENRIYYRTADALKICHLSGANAVSVMNIPASFLYIDKESARAYWSDEEGLHRMSAVQSASNIPDPAQIMLINEQKNITKIASISQKLMLKDY